MKKKPPAIEDIKREKARVVVNLEGDALSMDLANRSGIVPDILFFRDDGWILGAPAVFERVAWNLWKNDWTHFMRNPVLKWVDISEYLEL